MFFLKIVIVYFNFNQISSSFLGNPSFEFIGNFVFK
jgi:hypothetical protein